MPGTNRVRYEQVQPRSSSYLPGFLPQVQWKAQLLDGAAGLFGSESRGDNQGPPVDLTVLHAKIGELTLENDFLAGALGKAGLLSAKR
jgi:hypothetical protein